MLLHPQGALHGTELLSASDFDRSAHAAIFDAIARGVALHEPTDPAAIAVRLGQLLVRVGGASYLFDLLSDTPVTANLSWYANVVADRAKMRRLVEAGGRIMQLGHDASRDPGEAAAMALKAVTEATEQRSSADPVRWVEVIGPALQAIEEASKSGST